MTSLAGPATWLAGYIPDLPTPFDESGALDLAAFASLCERQIKAGVSAIVAGETTGEASTLTPAEHETIVRAAVEIARGRVRVIAGAGSNSTSHAIELTRRAEAAGADAVLSVVPYYNKPMQSGIHAHFQAIAGSTTLPIILHDVPARTIRELSDDTLARLAGSKQFIGLRDATGDITRADAAAAAAAARVSAAVRRRRDGAGFHRHWRRWLHLHDIECRAGAVPGDILELPAGAAADRAIPAESPCATDGRAFQGEPGGPEICAVPARLHVANHPPAHRRTGRCGEGRGRERDRRHRRRRSGLPNRKLARTSLSRRASLCIVGTS